MALPTFDFEKDAEDVVKKVKVVGNVAQAMAASLSSVSLPAQALHLTAEGLRCAKQLPPEIQTRLRHFHAPAEDPAEDSLPDVTLKYSDGGEKCFIREKDFCCHHCGKRSKKGHYCTKCKHVSYCGRECQLADWDDHKVLCRTIANVFAFEYGEEQGTRTFALKAFFQHTLQDFARPHRVKFWLSVVIKNLHTQDPIVAQYLAPVALCFVWHMTSACIAAPLREPLVKAAAAFGARARKLRGRGWKWQPVLSDPREQQHMAAVIRDMADGLEWLLATDPNMRPLMEPAAIAKLPQGGALQRLQGSMLTFILHQSISVSLAAPHEWDSTPALAIYTSVRGAGLLATPLGPLLEQDASEAVIKELLSDAPVEERSNTVLLGARADTLAELAPPGMSGPDDIQSASKKGMPSNQRVAIFDARGLQLLAETQSEALKVWRKGGSRVPALPVVTTHATSATPSTEWICALYGRKRAEDALDAGIKQQMRALGGAYARLLKAHNKSSACEGDPRTIMMLMNAGRLFKPTQFDAGMSEVELMKQGWKA